MGKKLQLKNQVTSNNYSGEKIMNQNKKRLKSILMLMAILFSLIIQTELSAFTLNVQDSAGNPVNGFRWQVEEDTTHPVTPGAEVADSLAVSIHKSYAPVVASGDSGSSTVDVNVPSDRRYVVSVLPYTGYSISGQNVATGQTAVTVVVNKQPIPTAQITIFVFHDNFSINNAPDAAEVGIEGFTVTISDAGGQQMMDVFGNPLGTTYQQNPDGSFILDDEGAPVVLQMGSGVITTDASGEATIRNIAPGKYGVQVIPPGGSGWIQTSTIEGTKVVDAWVKANEPPVFVELGPAAWHVFFGFVKQFNDLGTLPNPGGLTGQITGKVVYNHFDRPPNLQGFWPGEPVGGAWVGLNLLTGQGIYTAPCNANSTFTISNVPPGTYELVTWDENLISIFGFNQVTVPIGGGSIELGNILTFRWFGKLEGSVFYDTDQDGFRDPAEKGIANQNVNIRFRDGTVYQAQPTDLTGEYAFDAVFPFFKWLVTEVDFARFKATGITTVVDYGGQIPDHNGWDMPSFGKLNPQPQYDPNGDPIINPNTGNNLSLTEAGPVLTRAMHLFLGQVNVFDWGKISYSTGENGGISGIVFYDTTRAENDPRYCAGEPWQPGIPRVQVNLYRDSNRNRIIDDLNGDSQVTLADVDNYPFGWRDDPNLFGTEDIDRNSNGIFNAGDAIQIVTTDSWDDSAPTWAIHEVLPVIHGQQVKPGFDNFGTWNQAQPGVFDGGYAFASYFPGGIESGSAEVDGLPTETYIVEATTPPGYELVKEEDKNVDFGDSFIPSQLLLPPICVGEPHLVPQWYSFQTDVNGNPLPGIAPDDLIETAFYGQTRPLADRKQIVVAQSKNAAADFFFFTRVPKAARAVGFINNDLAAEFDPTSPIFGEKSAPSWLPISFQDWAGNEVARIYCDEFGAYNAMLPATLTANVPAPSGMSPQMLTFVINHPGPIPDPCNPGQMIIDPYFDADFSQSPFTFNFMPGTTTYLDTPVFPVAAFVGYPNRKLDVEPSDGTPIIYSVEGPDGGPIVCTDEATVTINSVGYRMVPNPNYISNDPNFPELIQRDFGFGGDMGTVTVGGTALNITSWSNAAIEATVDFAAVSTGTVQVTRGDNGLSTDLGVTLHVNNCSNVIHVSGGAIYPNTPIQDAIDAASNGALIIIEPGTYWENPIVYKPVTLQGSGAESTFINAMPVPSEKVSSWLAKVNQLFADGLIPTDAANFGAIQLAGILVYANLGVLTESSSVTIDGLQITGASAGGGIYAAGNADYLEIRNNKVKSNQGTLGGGITIGQEEAGLASNLNVKIHDNHIVKNGGMTGGGGVTIYNGATNYQITDNLIMGNFTAWSGAGIAHSGLSDNGLIARNNIVFNEVFYGGQIGGDGGGIYVGSTPNPEDPGEPHDGSGSVTINANLIQGNLAGSGFGGGICANAINGQDAADNPADPTLWYSLSIFNNIVVNNVAANAAGGIYLADAASAKIINNTIANNDSSGTAANAFTAGNLLQSNPQPAGVVAMAHSQNLANFTGQTYSNPVLQDNIIWQNISYYWDASLNSGTGGLAINAAVPDWDLAVIGLPMATYLNPDNCLLTNLVYGDGGNYNDGSNLAGNPLFVNAYKNTLVAAAVLDEGGNFITIRFNEIDRQGDYHITPGSPAVMLGSGTYVNTIAALANDFDGQIRAGYEVDSGADQITTIIFQASFDSGMDGFLYSDDTFRGTNMPQYARGTWQPAGGFVLGGLEVRLGNVNNSTVLGMSGGWQKSFTLFTVTSLDLSFWYRLRQSPNYENNEYSDAMLSIDGVLYGAGANDYLERIFGNGNGGGNITTGWHSVTKTLTLPAGNHTIIIGGYNNRKDANNEFTTVQIDNVVLMRN
jgi:parallel beta-helix repeat protein